MASVPLSVDKPIKCNEINLDGSWKRISMVDAIKEYLGKDYICDGWFKEGATNVDPKVSSLYYAADRKYNGSSALFHAHLPCDA